MTACKGECCNVHIPDKGKYTVTDELSRTSFTVAHEGYYAEYVFISPEAICSLKAVTDNGTDFKLYYRGVEVAINAHAVQTANDFLNALLLLKDNGIIKNGVMRAEVDNIYAIGTILNQRVSTIEFFNGTTKRIYTIITEA